MAPVRTLSMTLIALFAAILTACGPATPAPAPADTPAPTDQPPAQTPPADDDPQAPPVLTYTGTGLEDLTSYSARLQVEFRGLNPSGQPAFLTLLADLSGQADPPASLARLEFTNQGMQGLEDTLPAGLPSGRMNLLTTQDTSYIETIFGDESRSCFAFPFEETDGAHEPVVSVEDFVGAGYTLELTRVPPNETINGVLSRHYRAEGVQTDTLENAVIDLWTARDEGYVMRLVITNQGTSRYGRGTLTVTYDLLSANLPVDLTPFADCPLLAVPTPLP